VRKRITVHGRGNISTTHTSDLWRGPEDGRDYCIVDVGRRRLRADLRHHRPQQHRQDRLDPRRRAHDQRRDVSPDGRYASISREGASNRVNGVVILDLRQPGAPQDRVSFDQQLTGGVHNMFATNDHLFASRAREVRDRGRDGTSTSRGT
jgi:hypothetical protein